MKVELDEDKCIGAGQCILTAPDVFDQRDDDGIGVVLDPHPAPPLQAAARQAEAACPVGAITAAEDGSPTA